LETIIETNNLVKDYHTGDIVVHALKGINLEIHKGEFAAIMGASGSGKSTLMNILGCLDVPTSGDYFLDSVHVNTLSKRELADIRNQKIGFVFQGFNLLSRTSALENVEMPLLYNRTVHYPNPAKLAREALERVGLGDRLDHHPNQLSGGQQQRVAIARSLINNPSVILADEPSGNLDTRTSIEVLSIFQELNDQGITVLLITHERDIAKYARRNIEVKDGLILNDYLVEERKVAIDDLENIKSQSVDEL